MRIAHQRVTVERSDNNVKCDKIVTTAVSWMRHCLKTACRRMRRLLIVLFFILSATVTLGFFIEAYDPPPPPPEPDQEATMLSVDVLPEDDTVNAIERSLEAALGVPRGRQIPPESSFDRRVDEVAKVVAVHIKNFKD
ncbi:uncharacterized protein LOC129004724 [Macrosteles quadrilineatus]|uniref:uncharacterized protein LOC129004724 n=1 Tax=Macrosteles quadrilineatus TaxID=74068 RepID=UPI0023E241F7|nr:uncharacterized protein LOC129004724 [Macrosteles quadrilineatus]